MPWVRLHAVRDYFSMAYLASRHPEVRLTFNFSPSLLMQVEDYVERRATDEAWELTMVPAEVLDQSQRERLLATFFDADWHNQIFVHPRYRQLFEQRRDGLPFSAQDLRDLQAWFNLAWFGKELRDGAVPLPGRTSASVAELVRKGEGFTTEDVQQILAEQRKVMRAIIPIHRQLAERGQIELSFTPYFHPILPLIIDTDSATLDRPRTRRPERFAHPEDADAHIAKAVVAFRRWFGESPRGAWPAEGAISPAVVPAFGRHRVRWIATDQGVLARSGKWGYDVARSAVRHRLYRADEQGASISILFRDTELSDDIGFRCQSQPSGPAARGWVAKLKERARSQPAEGDPVVTVVLDGENAWGAYRDDGRPFLHALYEALAHDPEIRTVTPSELIRGNDTRGVKAHALEEQTRVYELFTGSWIDEPGSAPGVDLGTWIGEAEENQAWALLKRAREELDPMLDHSVMGTSHSYRALLAAEGSDWFWWFGDDQDSGHDQDFDELFRMHLATAYRTLAREVPPALLLPIVARAPLWTFPAPIDEIFIGDSLVVRTNCPGVVSWSFAPGGSETQVPLVMVGGVMAGVHRHQVRLGPFTTAGELSFRFDCRHPGCDCARGDACCLATPARIVVRPRPVP
jgi:alpha-amylase/alpha-mannosidase (GH57 family)